MLNSSYPWFALHVKPRSEKIVATMLGGKGCLTYLPLYRRRNQWSDRVVDIDYPLFPGYLFCSFGVSQRIAVITTPGIVSVLGSGGPEPIPEDELVAIQIMLRSGLSVGPHPYLREGEKIKITAGSLTGLEGLVIKNKKDLKVVVSVELLQRSVAVELDREAIRAASMIERFPSFSDAVSCY